MSRFPISILPVFTLLACFDGVGNPFSDKGDGHGSSAKGGSHGHGDDEDDDEGHGDDGKDDGDDDDDDDDGDDDGGHGDDGYGDGGDDDGGDGDGDDGYGDDGGDDDGDDGGGDDDGGDGDDGYGDDGGGDDGGGDGGDDGGGDTDGGGDDGEGGGDDDTGGDDGDTGGDDGGGETGGGDGGGGTTCYDLGSAADVNLWALTNYSGTYTDIEGKAVAGLDFTMTGFSLCLEDQGGTCLATGGTATLSNGQLYGDVVYLAGSAIGSDVTFATGGSASFGAPYNYGNVATGLITTASALSGATANGTTTVSSYGTVTMTGTDAAQNIFEVNASDLAAATYIEVNVPAGSVTLINVAGTSASVGSVGITLNGGSANATLWNFYEATTLALSAINFQGSALAPNATVTFNNGQFNGTMVGYDISGNGQYNLELFGHEICF